MAKVFSIIMRARLACIDQYNVTLLRYVRRTKKYANANNSEGLLCCLNQFV